MDEIDLYIYYIYGDIPIYFGDIKEEGGDGENRENRKKSWNRGESGKISNFLKNFMVEGDPVFVVRNAKKEVIFSISQRIKNCTNCELWKGRKNAVAGEGNVDSEVIFVGEAPGAEEDKKGRPFVGRSGELLEELISKILKRKREDVYITNVVRCKPIGKPRDDEVRICGQYLLEEIKTIKPKIVVSLGSTASTFLLGNEFDKITQIRGNFFDKITYKVFVTFHPAYVLRNPSAKKIIEEDFQKLKEEIEKMR